MANKINGKIVLITGASRGIGQAVAESLAKQGAKVALMARGKQRLEELCTKITSNGGSCFPVQADVADRKQVEDAVKRIEQHWGHVEILINNAAVLNSGSIAKVRMDDWLQIVDVNIKGVLHCIGATLKPMLEKGSGHIVNISSVGGKRTSGDMFPASPYQGSKFFMQGFSAGIRQELAPKGIRVCTVCPAQVLTELLMQSDMSDIPEQARTSQLFAQDPSELVNKNMMLLAEDIAETVSFILNQPPRVGVDDVVVQAGALPAL